MGKRVECARSEASRMMVMAMAMSGEEATGDASRIDEGRAEAIVSRLAQKNLWPRIVFPRLGCKTLPWHGL